MSPFEKACRALCDMDGNPENTPFGGKPMWMSYAPNVKAVLAALADVSPMMIDAAVAKTKETGPHDHVAIWRAMLGAVEK